MKFCFCNRETIRSILPREEATVTHHVVNGIVLLYANIVSAALTPQASMIGRQETSPAHLMNFRNRVISSVRIRDTRHSHCP